MRLYTSALLIVIAVLVAACGGGGGGAGGAAPPPPPPGTTTEVLTTSDDVFVDQTDPNQNFQSGSPSCPNCGIALKLIAPGGGFGGEARIFLKFWLFAPTLIPSGSTILSATLHLEDLSGSVNNSSDCDSFTVHRVTGVWFESTPTWNNQPSFDPQVRGAGILCGPTFSVNAPIDPSLVQDWVDNPGVTNQGIVIVAANPGVPGSNYKTMPSNELSGLGITLTVVYQQ